MKNNVSVFTKIYSIIIILLPFLYQYASPVSFLSLGDFAILIVTCFGLIKINYTHALKCIKPIVIFSASFCVLTLVVSLFSDKYFEYDDALTIFLKIILYLGVCAVSTQFFDLHYIKKIYLMLVRIFSVYLLVQVIYNKISGGFLPIYLKYDWQFSWEQRPEDLTVYYVSNGFYRFRPSSLFLEPGYYAMYVLPALFLLLFEDKKILEPVLLFFTIILSTSGAGIILGLAAFAMKGLTYIVYIKDGKVYFTRYAIIFILLIVAALIYLLGFDRELLPKLFNSFNARITRNFIIFNQTDLFHKIFGIGMNNVENYMNTYKIYTRYDEINLNYGASLIVSVVQYGIVGFLIFSISLISLFRQTKQSKTGMLLLILFVCYVCFEEVLFNYRMGFLMSFVIYYISRSKQRVSVPEKNLKTVKNLCEG